MDVYGQRKRKFSKPKRSRRTNAFAHLQLCSLQTAQEVGLLDRLPPGFSGTLGNLLALAKTLGGLGDAVHGCIAVVWCRCNIVGVVVRGDLGREGLGASGEFLLVALPLFLVQGCD